MGAGSAKKRYECLLEWLRFERKIDIYPKNNKKRFVRKHKQKGYRKRS